VPSAFDEEMRASFPLFLLVSCGARVAAGDESPWWETANTAALEKALYVRGVPCNKCTKAQLKKAMSEHAALPVDPELAEMHAEELRYRKHVSSLNMTKAEFVEQMNASEDGALDDLRAERVWDAYQAQLESGAVVFSENGTIYFGMPFTHRVAAFLPPAACDAIEGAYMAARSEYLSRVPQKNRRRLEKRLNYLVESGILYGVLALLALLLLLDAVRSFCLARSTDVPPAKGKSKGD